jgi:hypothetical protein
MLVDVDMESQPNPYTTPDAIAHLSPFDDWATRILNETEEVRRRNEDSLASIGAMLPKINSGVHAAPSFLPSELAPVCPQILTPVAPPSRDQKRLKFPEVSGDERSGMLATIAQQAPIIRQARNPWAAEEKASSLHRVQVSSDGQRTSILPVLSLRCRRS